jgi:transposase
VPDELDCHVVLDNASTHKTPVVKRWLTNHLWFVLHFTPTSSSWLNLVERWWTKTADQILASIANYCNRINESGHQ